MLEYSVQRIPDRECWTVLTNNIFQAENVEEYSHTSYSRQKMLDSTHVWLIPDRRMLDSTHRQHIPIRKCWTVLRYIVFQTEKVGEYSHTVFQTDIPRTVLTYNVFMIENVGQYSRTMYSRQRKLLSTHVQCILDRECWTVFTYNVLKSENVRQFSHRT